MSWIQEIKQKHDIMSVFELIGMQGKRLRYGPCQCCNADRTSKDTRPPVRASGRHSWWCNNCEAHGDIFDLVSYHLYGTNSKGVNFTELKQFFMERHVISKPRSTYKADDMAEHPPQAQVAWLIKEGLVLDDWRVEEDVWNYLFHRGINPISTSARRANTELDHGKLRWVANSSGKKMPWWPSAWRERFPIILPMYDHTGKLCSLHGRSIDPTATRKTSAPLGFSAKGLFFLNSRAIQMCHGDVEPKEVWFTEGEIDFLSLEQYTKEEQLTVVGIKAGSLTTQLLPIPPRAKIFICTDPDETGDKYAQKIIRLYPNNPLLRVRHG